MSAPTTFWRLAGLSYMQYVSKSSAVVRTCLKETSKVAQDRGAVSYNNSVFKTGEQIGEKVAVTNLREAGAHLRAV